MAIEGWHLFPQSPGSRPGLLCGGPGRRVAVGPYHDERDVAIWQPLREYASTTAAGPRRSLWPETFFRVC